ncbi:hypothetical protein SORBI_3005G221900 [Sorghum bicolor]|uniref:Uncharacterized protein n=1 Tax=Sorghum bicolor TaxID=4558 RepID=A0A1B6PU20_SORBI|nr:hypothetical protein SORBI_3005G221900 [Sorghum bicolor]KXG29169.1 hypothetical protein SORBI_3005G221900 [Sorghum bicolor]
MGSWLHNHHSTHYINDGKGKIQCLLPYDCCPNFSTVNTTQQKICLASGGFDEP